MEHLKRMILKNRSLKQNTLQHYINNIDLLYRELFNLPSYDGDVNKLKKYSKVINFLEKRYENPKTRKNYITTIIVVLKSMKVRKYVILKYLKCFDKLKNEIDNQYKTHELNQKEKDNFLSWDDILKIKDRLKEKYEQIDFDKPDLKGDLDICQQYLILSLYTDIPPVRNDYVNTKFTEDVNKEDMKHNYIDVQKQEFYLNFYKTVGIYGVKIINIPNNIIEIIKNFRKINTTAYLLVNLKQHKPMNANNLTRYINKIFKHTGKNISTSMLRKIYISTKLIYNKNLEENKRELANKMMHSVSMQRDVYTKNLSLS